MKKIEMVDLKGQYLKIKKEVDSGIQEVIDSSTFIKGGKVNDFQKNLENYLKVKHVIPVANGTDALQIALMALDLKPGDEVITPAFTFIATAEVIALLGLIPVMADVDFDTFNITPEAFRNAITPKTKAVIPVHLFGQNADMEEILKIASEKNIYVVEDACQSIGALNSFSNGSKVFSGCMGEIGCTSFFPSKNLGCFGDGGAIFTNNDDLAAKMRAIANHGMVVRYYHDFIGVNSRLDSIQAAVLDVKLSHLDNYIEARQQAASFYDKVLGNNEKLIVPARCKTSSHVFHQYTLKLNGIDRAELQKFLATKEIPTMVYYPVPLHLQRAFSNSHYKKGDLPISEKLSECVISLPMHTELTQSQLEFVTENILDFCEKQKTSTYK